MAEQSPEMLAALQALLAQAQQQPAPAAGGGWAQPAQPTASLPITGISIPVKIETPIGSVRVDLHLPAECGQSPQALMGAIQALANAGYPVDAWKPKEQQGWSGGGGSGGGGWGGNGNNYGGGANYGRGGFGGRRW